jgi:hypothetical protein
MKTKSPSPSEPAGHQPHIVIPYNYVDHGFASKLTAALRQDRITPWIDDIDMSAGTLLVHRVAQAARPVDFVIPAISSASLASNWVQRELKVVMARSFLGRHVRVLPARVDNCVLPDFLTSLPFLDFHRNGWDAAYGDLIVTMQKHTGSVAAKAPPPSYGLPRPARLT